LSNGKDIILKYCSQYTESSLEHIQNAIDNKRLIEQGRYSELSGCPSSYGLDDFNGLCFEEKVEGNKEQYEQCERCWKKALNV
jgi:hypothetical protein